uniref:MAT homeobox alpha 2 protein n=1 Tax=Suhomyces emberorum TaxID=246006 RepID=A0A3S9NLW0_9ASCO|nr:MAT homeobox alpha 2 protein [Suhomyces emberorum]
MSNRSEFLKSLEFQLGCHINTVCLLDEPNIQKLVTENEASLHLLNCYLQGIILSDQADLLIIKKILDLVKLLKLLVLQRVMMCEAHESTKRTPQKFVIPKRFVKLKSSKIRDDQIDVLEEWYSYNHFHPYLKESSKEDLHIRTGLSQEQIKFWVSDKRRREKSKVISPELKPFLS